MQTRADLVRALNALGVTSGDLVMVHASVRAVGAVLGGPDEIWRAVVDAVSPGGAMMMYVDIPDGYDDIGRKALSPEEEAMLRAHLPALDFQNARAQREYGALAELFRSSPGALCSEQAGARMAAHGDRAAWLMADAPWDYGYGLGSPLDKLRLNGGKILLLQSDHDEVTFLHHVEHIADFPGKRIVSYEVPVSQDGVRVWRRCEEFNTGGEGVHANWPDRFFAQIVDDFIAKADPSACRIGMVGGAMSVLISAPALAAHAIPIMVARARMAGPNA